MPLSAIDQVRSKIGDMNKSAVNEAVAQGDGVTTIFQLDMFPVRTGSVTWYRSGTVTSASINLVLGTVDVTGSAPSVGDKLVATYQYNALSDQEIEDCISLASAGGVLMAASYALRSIAANYARFFSYTQGDKSINKDRLADKLIALAESYEEAYENGGSFFGVTTMRFDDSGTVFDSYDTASSNNGWTSTNNWSI